MKHLKNVNVESLIANHIAECEKTGAMHEQHKGFARDMFRNAAKKADTRRNAQLIAELNAKGGQMDADAYGAYFYVRFEDGTQKRIRKETAEVLRTLKAVPIAERSDDYNY